MKMNRRNFLGLSGASVLAGLVKKWVPEKTSKYPITITTHAGHKVPVIPLEEFQVARYYNLTPKQWFEQRQRQSRAMMMAMNMEIHIQWHACDDDG